jgi:hypothetical protein
MGQVVAEAMRVVAALQLEDSRAEAISRWLVEGDGVDFPGFKHFLAYGEKVNSFRQVDLSPAPPLAFI